MKHPYGCLRGKTARFSFGAHALAKRDHQAGDGPSGSTMQDGSSAEAAENCTLTAVNGRKLDNEMALPLPPFCLTPDPASLMTSQSHFCTHTSSASPSLDLSCQESPIVLQHACWLVIRMKTTANVPWQTFYASFLELV
ncbi:hypothetical protein AOLI_G00240700 [Acnodon oligacanthus]